MDNVNAAQSQSLAEDFGVIGRVETIADGSAQGRLSLGALERLESSEDPSLRMTGTVGSHVKMRVAKRWLLACVREVRLGSETEGTVWARLEFLGEGVEKAEGGLTHFTRGITRYPKPGAKLHAVSRRDLEEIYAANLPSSIDIGTIHPTNDLRGSLSIDPLLVRHFALVGSTGTGKSTLSALILHRIMHKVPHAHIVMLDPHGEYANAFGDKGVSYNVDNLKLPYWLMNFEEHCEVLLTSEGADRAMDMDILSKCIITARAKNRLATTYPKLTVDSPIPYLLSDLLNSLTQNMGKLEKASDIAPYLRIRSKIDELRNDNRYNFMFNGLLVSDSMSELLANIFRLPNEGQPIAIIDLSGVPSDIVAVVVSLIGRMAFDYAIWSTQEPRRPILLVCEEAHRYIPAERVRGTEAVRKILERIAKEGRKYGVSLGLVTQRPSDLAEGVLSQCGTIISMRLNNERDQTYVRNTLPEGARHLLDAVPALRNRECIVCGEGVVLPIRITLDEVPPDMRPASFDPAFSHLWSEAGDESGILERTITRWRSQTR